MKGRGGSVESWVTRKISWKLKASLPFRKEPGTVGHCLKEVKDGKKGA